MRSSVSCKISTWAFPGVKTAEVGLATLILPSAVIVNMSTLVSTSPRVFVACNGDTYLTFVLFVNYVMYYFYSIFSQSTAFNLQC